MAACCVLLGTAALRAEDWPQWGGQMGRNMASAEKHLPPSFVPGEKRDNAVDPATAKNVKWAVAIGSNNCTTPAVAEGKVVIGGVKGGQGLVLCFDQATGKLDWQLAVPMRSLPEKIDGRKYWYRVLPPSLGICSSPAIQDGRVYLVTQRCEVVCLDLAGLANGNDGPFQDEKSYCSPPDKDPGQGKLPGGDVIWMFDMYGRLGVRPSDACNCSVLILGDFVYVCTSNGIDRDADARMKDEFRKPPAPKAPTLIVLDKKTGELLAADDEKRIIQNTLHGQWSSPSAGRVGDKTLVFLGGGDGVCYAWEALASRPAAAARRAERQASRPSSAPAIEKAPARLKLAWSFDCNPPEYKQFGGMDLIKHYCVGDRRRSDTINKPNDGSFVGMSEIIATPAFHEGRVYVAIGRDPEHGRGRGALWCIQASQTGDITQSGRVWCYQGLDRSLSTVSIADGLLYAADVAGRVHCLDAATGKPLWVYETNAQVWGSTLAADGKVYLPTKKGLFILAAGQEKKLLGQVDLGAPMWASPVAANGVLYVASTRYLWAVK